VAYARTFSTITGPRFTQALRALYDASFIDHDTFGVGIHPFTREILLDEFESRAVEVAKRALAVWLQATARFSSSRHAGDPRQMLPSVLIAKLFGAEEIFTNLASLWLASKHLYKDERAVRAHSLIPKRSWGGELEAVIREWHSTRERFDNPSGLVI